MNDLGEPFEKVLRQVEGNVIPEKSEEADLKRCSKALLNEIKFAIPETDEDFIVDIVQTGSTSRGTWLKGDSDIDFFIRFHEEIDIEVMKKLTFEIASSVLDDMKISYASHPYAKGTYEEYDVDIVPCTATDPSDIDTAVDRTPHHSTYLKNKLSDMQKNQVRFFKKLLQGTNLYGADIGTQGFSGLLCELLVLKFNNIVDIAEWASGLSSFPEIIDIEGHGSTDFESSDLIVIDPVDPNRNVASNLSDENFSRFRVICNEFLRQPSTSFFTNEQDVLSKDNILTFFMERNTEPVLLTLLHSNKDLNIETIEGQRIKTERQINRELTNKGFDIFRSNSISTLNSSIFLFEFINRSLPNVKREIGPPVNKSEACESFIDKYSGVDGVVGPFVSDNRLIVEKNRSITDATEYFCITNNTNIWDNISLGSDYEEIINDSDIIINDELCVISNKLSGVEEFHSYFYKSIFH